MDATIAREGLWQAQTPQMFRYGVLKKALAETRRVTDRSQGDRSGRSGAEARQGRRDQPEGDLPGRPAVGRTDHDGEEGK